MTESKRRHKGMVIKPVRHGKGVRYRVPNLGGNTLHRSVETARRAIDKARR